ncbi:hypothetical protein HMPREF0204_10869 [Chryseobacterium gleum ATCC 35910]|uniref:Uncharacterized protein n=1 Tax=Chryseobacterium gleum ATCC 35910 TaxID=525257 RepID=A0ABN0AV74_CHRGE|nr:hypothetical protein HMPREF0204_10869 [Chryseobacterium gleum ATCC 35910]
MLCIGNRHDTYYSNEQTQKETFPASFFNKFHRRNFVFIKYII